MKFKNFIFRVTAFVLSAAFLFSLSSCTENGETTTTAWTPSLQTDSPDDIPGDNGIKVTTSNATSNINFNSLSLGSVKADSWLLHQARLIADNITKDFEQLSPDCKSEGDDRSGWLGGTGESWERGPYYVRGLVSLAYVLDDRELKEQAQKWIEWTLASQSSDGAFGPYAHTPGQLDPWPLMPMLMALELYADATGDERVVPFLKKYFDWQYKNLEKNPLKDQGQARGGDNILAVYWYMEKTGDRSYEKLAELLHKQTQDWSAAYVTKAWSNSYQIVNVSQSFKLYPIMFALTGDNKYLDIYYKGLENLYISSGRSDGMSNGDEFTRGILATHGSETCSVVERMLSDEIALVLLRDASIADRLENIAYNALPQQLLPDGKGQVYFTMENQIDASLGNRGFSSDGGDRSVYGAPGGFPCCVHNYQMGWPLFIASMWMSTSDGGLAAGAYGPCNVNATVGNNTHVTLTEETNYPYEESVTITVSADKTDTYPIYLRIPEWCDMQKGPTVKINGEQINGAWISGEYFCLTNEWHDGDTIQMSFPGKLTVEYGDNNSVSVRYGGVLFALALTENMKETDYNPLGWARQVGSNKYSSYSITTTDIWNLALTELDINDPQNTFTFTANSIGSDMTYTQADAPMILTAKARQVRTWTKRENNTAGALPVSPLSSDKLQGEDVTVRLIPYAFTRLRITAIPWVGTEEVTHNAQRTEDNRTLIFRNVIATTDVRSINDVSPTSVECNLEFNFSATDKDLTFIVSINNKDAGRLILKKGESRAVISKYKLKNSSRNKITLTLDGGELLPKEMSSTLKMSSTALKTLRYEAEFGKISGSCYVVGDHITGIENTGDSVTFTISIPSSDNYVIRSFYCAHMNEATHTLKINGADCGQFNYRKTNDGQGIFSEDIYSDIHIPLSAGEHKITVIRTANDTGFAELDAIEISPEVKRI